MPYGAQSTQTLSAVGSERPASIFGKLVDCAATAALTYASRNCLPNSASRYQLPGGVTLHGRHIVYSLRTFVNRRERFTWTTDIKISRLQLLKSWVSEWVSEWISAQNTPFSAIRSRFRYCSINVKLTLLKTYCLCLYDTALWKNFSATVYGKLKSAYNKCIKKMFGYTRRDSWFVITYIGCCCT